VADAGSAEPWWKSAVMYQIYPRSFADSNGDGVGDLEGIRRRLAHLAWLGVDAVWLSPFYRSPMQDFGYDVADYCDVDPLFGSLADFDRVLAEAHAHGLRVLIDWVPNHTSDQHPWFVASRASRRSPQRNWYVWRDGRGDGPPNNWRRAFGEGPAWTRDAASGQWYLHLFLPGQPDLDWSNPEVERAMHDTLRFWLDRGVDGFRVDVVHALGKDPVLPDNPPGLDAFPMSALNDQPSTHPIVRRIRGVLEEYPGDRVMVGEVFLLSTEQVARYYGEGDELHLAFNFPPLFAPWDAGAWRGEIERVATWIESRGAWPTWVLSNHDNRRHRSRYGGSEARARAAAVLLLGLRGTPFLYAGEELGLEDATVTPSRQLDPGGRDGSRAPIPWSIAAPHGWDGADPWLPWPPDAASRSVEALCDDPTSILHLYKRLLAARRGSQALRLGTLELVDAPEGVVAWERACGDDHRLVVVNFTAAPRPIVLPNTWRIGVASDGAGEGEVFAGTVGADQALILQR
jgi:alpha-glucosidase